MNLIVDIGNTRVKLALTQGGEVVEQYAAERLAAERLDAFLAGRRPARSIVSSTRGAADELLGTLRPRTDYLLEFTAATPVPIGNAYRTPATLGRDRLAAAVGAATLFPDCDVLIVDFGTALTLDLLTADGVFRGGCISPGLRMRLRALHDYTAALPLCAPAEYPGLLGRSTEEALVQGAINSLTFEVEGYIGRLREKFDDLRVIFTGGDANFFEKRIKNTIFANRNLVLCGLDRILEYNAREEYLD